MKLTGFNHGLFNSVVYNSEWMVPNPEDKKRILIMKNIISTLTAFCLVFYLPSCQSLKDSKPSKPNILLIISDDQAWDDYSFLGHPQIETPSIDKLASEGQTFTYGYVSAPLCRPSLASIVTGLYPHQHGITGNDPAFEFDGIQKWGKEWTVKRAGINQKLIDRFNSMPTITSLLSNQGYISFQSGKWWEGSWADGGFTDGMTHGDPENNGRHGDEGLKIGRDGLQPVFDFIDKAGIEQKPFFIWYAPFMPHTPHTPPDSLYHKYRPLAENEPEARYMAMVEWFDITVGQLSEFLEHQDLVGNTLIIYVCDNGWITNPQGNGNPPYAPKSKQTPYEMGIRTPIMVKWPGKVAPRMDTSTFVSSLDILPTILHAIQGDIPPGLPGLNLLDRDAITSRQVIFSEDFTHDMPDPDKSAKSLEHLVVLKSPWKLIIPYNEMMKDGSLQLYNVIEDPYETLNLAEQNPEIVKNLREEQKYFWQPDF